MKTVKHNRSSRALILCGILMASPWLAWPALANDLQSGSKLLVVDCLLPGQVRKLGTSVTYLTARRAVKTAAGDCELRGGEYVESDRSNYASALKIWFPGARDGDKVAQTYVGEIFEKGAGTPPDYAAAASWYQKAADQGYARAQINLGFLYEKGLGVAKDPVAALNLYRKASGIADAIVLDDGSPGTAGGSERELMALRRELEQARNLLDNARKELEQQKRNSQSEVQRLEEQRRKAVDTGNTSEVKRLEGLLTQREEELSRRSQDVTRLEQQMSGYRTQLASLQSDSAGLREQLERAREQLSGSQRELTARRSEMADTQKRLDTTRADLDQQKKEVSSAVQGEAKHLQAQLLQREEELKRQAQELARAELQAQRYRDEMARLEQRVQTTAQPIRTAASPPSIQVIDPPIVLTRGAPAVQVRGGLGTREIVGRVIAAGGLLSFSVNDRSEDKAVDANGLFRVTVALSGKATPVSLVAIDQQGKRSVVEFSLVPDGATVVAAAPVAPKLPPMNFGTFYALVIGNEKYQHLPQLKTAVNDAVAISDVLTRKYGFKTTTLKNATRYQILSELNRLRAQLTENDNLLIYYAGHGELDKANLRGHWLPVDAEERSDANWISSVAITDILNAMSVKHVLVVADSCYSGALTRSSIGQLETGRSEEERVNWLKAMTKMRSRVVLTSGGLQPVLDGGGGNHSVFARSFLEVLNVNSEIIEARRVYQELSARVLNDALKYRIEQVPQYAAMQFAGHESGDFLFVRAAN